MPRLARLDAPGVLHHVIGRGIEKKEIFLGVKDRNDFLGRLAELVKNHAMDIYAWALLPNHFHLLCKTLPKTAYGGIWVKAQGYGHGHFRTIRKLNVPGIPLCRDKLNILKIRRIQIAQFLSRSKIIPHPWGQGNSPLSP